jgi:hypothetical protein
MLFALMRGKNKVFIQYVDSLLAIKRLKILLCTSRSLKAYRKLGY